MRLDIHPQPAVRRKHDCFDVEAAGLGRYTIDVSLPAHVPDGERLPVILAVDGNLLFDFVQAVMHGNFATVSGMLPPAVVVGVGYPASEGFASFYGRRNFDFLEHWDMCDPMGQQMHAIFDMLKRADGRPDLTLRTGGYQRFMGFLRDELLPALAAHYPIDTRGPHTLVGASSGGSFTLRALFDPSSPFSRYVAISPSLAVGGGLVRAEAEYAASCGQLTADVFACAGAVEIDESRENAVCRFGSAVIWLAEQFAVRQWSGARLHWEIMNNEDHVSIAPRAIAAGLRSVLRLRPGVHRAEIAAAQAVFRSRFSR